MAELVVNAVFRTSNIRFNISHSKHPADGRVARHLWTVAVDDQSVGAISRLRLDAPVWASPAYAFELDITNAASVEAAVEYQPLPVTPAAEIDLALLVPEGVTAEDVEKVIRSQAGDVLERAVLFDEFQGPGLEAGRRSLAWRLTFRHPDRTLRDREIEARKEKLISAVARELGVRARTG